VRQQSYANEVMLRAAYDGDRQPERWTYTHRAEANLLEDWQYRWDEMHNRTARTDVLHQRKTVYRHDSTLRLTGSRVTQNEALISETGFELDGAGNRLSVTTDGVKATYQQGNDASVQDAAMNQYTATPFNQRSSDANGNLIEVTGNDVPTLYQYDYRNQLVRITSGDVEVRYNYDPLGRRIGKTLQQDGEAQRQERYVCDGWRVIEEHVDGDIARSYVNGPRFDQVISMRARTGGYWYHQDDQNTVLSISDTNGLIVERYSYDAHGSVQISSASGRPLTASLIGNPYAFQGRRLDQESGWYYFRHRYYDPSIGRFTSRDHLGVSQVTTQQHGLIRMV
jgi:RHS repeat-associated protein